MLALLFADLPALMELAQDAQCTMRVLLGIWLIKLHRAHV